MYFRAFGCIFTNFPKSKRFFHHSYHKESKWRHAPTHLSPTNCITMSRSKYHPQYKKCFESRTKLGQTNTATLKVEVFSMNIVFVSWKAMNDSPQWIECKIVIPILWIKTFFWVFGKGDAGMELFAIERTYSDIWSCLENLEMLSLTDYGEF